MTKDKYDQWRQVQNDDGWMYRRVMESLIKRAEETLEFYAQEAKAEVQWLEDRGQKARDCLAFLRERNMR